MIILLQIMRINQVTMLIFMWLIMLHSKLVLQHTVQEPVLTTAMHATEDWHDADARLGAFAGEVVPLLEGYVPE